MHKVHHLATGNKKKTLELEFNLEEIMSTFHSSVKSRVPVTKKIKTRSQIGNSVYSIEYGGVFQFSLKLKLNQLLTN